MEFKHYSKEWKGWSEHYGEWFEGDLEYGPGGTPAIRRDKKEKGTNGEKLSEWIFVKSDSVEKKEG